MEMRRSIIFFLILITIAGQLVDGTKYKPYVTLVTGFMLLSLMVRPVMTWIGGDVEIQDVFSQITKETDTLSFEEDAADAREQQIQNGITAVLKEYGIEARRTEVTVDGDGAIEEIQIEAADGEKQEEKIKTVLSRFYNLEGANINISE